MTQEEINNIISEIKEIKDLPNGKLVSIMDNLTIEFESVKETLIQTSFYLDKIEEIYNKVLKEYQNRTK
jgi:flagellar motor switch protein FliG